MKCDWEGYFQPYILERAQKCVREHRVKRIQRTKAGYEATVQGEKEYRVVIEKEKDYIRNMGCNCFYVQKRGRYCKHMAAVLYELETAEKRDEEKRRSNLGEIKEMIGLMSRREMEIFLYETAREFRGFERELRLFAAGHASEAERERQKCKIDEIILRYADSDGLLQARTEALMVGEIEAFFQERTDRMIGYGGQKAAAELIAYAFGRLIEIGMEDKGGVFSEFTNFCLRSMEKMVRKSGGTETKSKIYEWIQRRLSDEIPDTVKERLYDFIMEHFEEAVFLEKKLDLLNEKIRREEERQGETDRRNAGRDLARKLQVMEQLCFPEKECEDYRKKFWRVPEIRQMELQRRMEKEKYKEAEELIAESIKIDDGLLEWQEIYSRQQIEIYRRQHRKEEYQRELIQHFLTYRQDSIELWREIRALFSEENWKEEREAILREIDLPYCRFQIMAEEKMLLRLIEELKREKILEFLDQYEKIVRRKFPEEMLRMYADCLVNIMPGIRGRERYREIAAHLEKMKTYPGGAEAVENITADWKRRYRARTALMEELAKLEEGPMPGR